MRAADDLRSPNAAIELFVEGLDAFDEVRGPADAAIELPDEGLDAFDEVWPTTESSCLSESSMRSMKYERRRHRAARRSVRCGQ